jgi:hypothetical protein
LASELARSVALPQARRQPSAPERTEPEEQAALGPASLALRAGPDVPKRGSPMRALVRASVRELMTAQGDPKG